MSDLSHNQEQAGLLGRFASDLLSAAALISFVAMLTTWAIIIGGS